VVVNTVSDHIATHFSPAFDVKTLISENIDHPCREPELHCIINHKGQYLLCCDDVIGNFDLGTFPEVGLKEYWYGKRMEIEKTLINVGGRRNYSYCSTCPRI